MSSLRERNKLDKQRRIREAAWSLFRELGFEGTTTKRIAERADIGTGTLFLYARTKEELLFLLFRDELESILRARFESLPPGLDFVGAFVHVCRGFYERYAEDRDLGRRFVQLLFTVEGPPREAMEALNAEFVGRIARAIEAEKARGTLRRDVDTWLLATNSFGLYGFHVLSFLTRAEGSPEVGVTILDRSLRMLVEGCRPA